MSKNYRELSFEQIWREIYDRVETWEGTSEFDGYVAYGRGYDEYRWLTNVAAALSLPVSSGAAWRIQYEPPDRCVVVLYVLGGKSRSARCRVDSIDCMGIGAEPIARAACEIWLQHDDDAKAKREE